MPFALSLSKGRSSPSPSRKKRTVLRQAQDERFWGGRSLRRLHRARQTRRHLGDVARPEAADHIAAGEIARAAARGEARAQRARVGDALHCTVDSAAPPRGARIGPPPGARRTAPRPAVSAHHHVVLTRTRLL